VRRYRRGTDVHHIIERNSARRASDYATIYSPLNQVRISRIRHWQITGWYQTPNPDFGGRTPREYLRGRDLRTREEVGLGALRRFGVLR
jgi:hypothetical protein